MPCPDPIIDPRGREGLGVVQPQSGIDYPLLAPSSDIRYLLADFFLSYEDPADYDSDLLPYTPPFKIGWLYGLGCVENAQPDGVPDPTHDADLLILDADDRVVFDSTAAEIFSSREWNTNYYIYEWLQGMNACRLVQHTAWSPDETPAPHDYDLHIVPDNGTLLGRTIFRVPQRVKSLQVVLDTIAQSQVELIEGFNISLKVDRVTSKPGRRVRTRVTISAIPGAGQGIKPGCDEVPLQIRRINGVPAAPTGEFHLAATDCYWVRQPTVVISEDPRLTTPAIDLDPLAYHLQVGDDCGPCCSCEDYVDIGLYLNRLRDRYVAIGNRSSGVRTLYHTNLTRWTDALACRVADPVRIAMASFTCPDMEIAGQFCNTADACARNVTLEFSFDTTPVPHDLVLLACGFTSITNSVPRETVPYELDGTLPTLTAVWDAVNPHDSVSVKFRLAYPNDGVDDDGVPFTVTTTVTGRVDGVIVGTATKTLTLSCPATTCDGTEHSGEIPPPPPPVPPVAPSHLTAVATSLTAVDLDWDDNSDDETLFRIQHSTDGISWANLTTVAADSTSYTHATADFGPNYYRIRAENGVGNSPYSNTALGDTTPSIPIAPGNLTATSISSTRIDLDWDDNSFNEASFRIQRSPDGSTWSNLATVGVDVDTYNDTSPLSGLNYYRVRAENLGGNSAYSNTDSAQPLPISPSDLAATGVSTGINLAWTDNSSNETLFRIQHSTNGISWADLTTTAANATTYSDTSPDSGTNYYRIRAENAGGNSAYSNTSSATTVPNAPSGLAATTITAARIDLTWVDNSSNEANFKLQRSADGSSWSDLTSPAANATSYSDTSPLGARNYYRIRAENAFSSSSYSSTASATTLTADLVSFWKLGEGSGIGVLSGATRMDSIGTNHLNDSAAYQTTGVIGNAVAFTPPMKCRINSPTTLTDGGNFTWGGWVRYNNTTTAQQVTLSRANDIVFSPDYQFYLLLGYAASRQMSLIVQQGDGSDNIVTATNFGNFTNNVWTFVLFSYNNSTKVLSIRINNGTANTVTLSSLSAGNSRPISFGSSGWLYDPAGLSGAMDAWGLWRRLLTNDEQSDLYIGKEPPF